MILFDFVRQRSKE